MNVLKLLIQNKSPEFVEMYNIIILSLAFFFSMLAYLTCALIAQPVLEGVQIETDNEFTGNGFTSLCLIFSFSTIGNTFASTFICYFGPKSSMIIGSSTNILYLCSYCFPQTWLLYLSSIILGFGESILWAAQGTYISQISTETTITRNNGIFSLFVGSCIIFGNTYIQYIFKEKVIIFKPIREQVFIILIICSVIGTLTFLLLVESKNISYIKKNHQSISQEQMKTSQELINLVPCPEIQHNPPDTGTEENRNFLSHFIKCFSVLLEKMKDLNTILLCIVGIYQGVVAAFDYVYLTTVGHTQQYGSNAKSIMGLCGIAYGCGILFAGFMFGIFGKWLAKKGRDLPVMLMFILTIISIYLTFLNFPAEAPIRETAKLPFLGPRVDLAIICAFLFAIIEASFYILVNSMIGLLFPSDCAPVFCIVYSSITITGAVVFFYSLYLQLQWHCLIIVIISLIGSWSYFVIEWKYMKERRNESLELSIMEITTQDHQLEFVVDHLAI